MKIKMSIQESTNTRIKMEKGRLFLNEDKYKNLNLLLIPL